MWVQGDPRGGRRPPHSPPPFARKDFHLFVGLAFRNNNNLCVSGHARGVDGARMVLRADAQEKSRNKRGRNTRAQANPRLSARAWEAAAMLVWPARGRGRVCPASPSPAASKSGGDRPTPW